MNYALLPPAGEYKRLRALIMGPGKGNKGLMQQMSKQMGRGGNMNSHNMQQNIAQMSRMLPPQARSSFGYCSPMHDIFGHCVHVQDSGAL